ncbi:MAG: N-acetylmuramoyl-L-alanine amidase [Bacteroidota bacterium]
MRLGLILLSLLGLFSSSYHIQGPEPASRAAVPMPQLQDLGLAGPIRTLIIDPGHGGKDPGAVGASTYEKDVALGVGLKLKEIVNQNLPQVKVVMTRESDDFIPLYERGEIAQDNEGDFFISIHCNGIGNKHSHGAETYILGVNKGQENYERIIEENQAVLFEDNFGEFYGGYDPQSAEANILFDLTSGALRSESKHLAEKVQIHYAEAKGRNNRGVKQAPFIVLYMCGMPAILTEIGFITNEKEEAFLGSEEGQEVIANGLFQSIEAYNQEFQ